MKNKRLQIIDDALYMLYTGDAWRDTSGYGNSTIISRDNEDCIWLWYSSTFRYKRHKFDGGSLLPRFYDKVTQGKYYYDEIAKEQFYDKKT